MGLDLCESVALSRVFIDHIIRLFHCPGDSAWAWRRVFWWLCNYLLLEYTASIIRWRRLLLLYSAFHAHAGVHNAPKRRFQMACMPATCLRHFDGWIFISTNFPSAPFVFLHFVPGHRGDFTIILFVIFVSHLKSGTKHFHASKLELFHCIGMILAEHSSAWIMQMCVS